MSRQGLCSARFLTTPFLAMVLMASALWTNPSVAAEACAQGTSLTVPLPDPASGRKYELYVSLPAGYAESSKRLPLLVLADGGRAFPKRRCEVQALFKDGTIKEEPLIVGLSYAAGESLEDSRRRDYTPTPLKSGGRTYGGAAAYQAYIRDVVLKHVDANYRVDSGRRIYWGHSYGGLLGAHILLTEPALFQTYLLGSPSFWFDEKAIYGVEEAYSKRSKRLDATVLMYVGGSEIARYDPARKGNTRDMVSGMKDFEARLRSRNYSGLKLSSTIVPNRDHRSSIPQGFAWSLAQALQRP